MVTLASTETGTHILTAYDGSAPPAPVFNYRLGTFAPPVLNTTHASSVLVARGPGMPAAAPVVVPSLAAEEDSAGFDWFQKVHILPRVPVALGPILNDVSVPVDVFNAFRSAITYTAFANTIGAGVSPLPDFPSPPQVLPAFASFLGPASVRLAPVRPDLVVSKEGAPLFDGLVSFVFGAVAASLRLSGSRVSLFPFFYEADFTERLTFTSEPLEALDGTEQVLSLAGYPVQSFDLTFVADGDDRARIQTYLFGGQPRLVGLPVWTDEVAPTAAASIGALSVATTSTTDADFRVGGLAVLYDSFGTFDVVVLSAVGPSLLSFATTPLLNNYTTAARIAPVRLGFFAAQITAQRFITSTEEIRASFRVFDNWTGAPTGSLVGWSTHNGRVLLDDCNVTESSGIGTELTQRITVIDSGLGRVEQVSDWPTNRRTLPKTFAMRGRAAVAKVKRLLRALRGPQVSFYLPTFADDIRPVADAIATAFTLDIAAQGYARFAANREPKARVRVTFTDGTSLFRVVQSSAEVSSTVERLTFDATWPVTRTVAEFARIEFVEHVRFAGDVFTFEHRHPLVSRLSAGVKTLIQ